MSKVTLAPALLVMKAATRRGRLRCLRRWDTSRVTGSTPNGMAPFWRELPGVHVDTTTGNGEFVILSPTEDGLTIGLQQVPEAKSGKNRMPLDLVVADLDAATTEVEQLGGRWLAPGTTRELEGFRWRCVADPPEGNEFDLDVVPAGS
jgi:predicted enzyme related to lactoylglutathione lyase